VKLATCHSNRAYHAKGFCKQCYKSLWKRSDPNRNKWRSFGTGRERALERHREYYSSHKREEKDSRLRRTYGITLEDYEHLLEQQNFQCYFCEVVHSDKKPLHVDHDHETNRIRGLLCLSHNQAIAKFGDSPAGVTNLLQYLIDGKGVGHSGD
jgi:Recombination endonuclease VII